MGTYQQMNQKMQEKWNEMDINKLQMERTAGRPEYVLHDGPHMQMVIFILAMR